jgi:fatty acid desaturase
MPEELEQRIRHKLQEADSAAAPHELAAPSQVWSRLQFRLAYRPRRDTYATHGSIILVAVYLLAFLTWSTWSTGLDASLIAVLAAAAAVAVFLCMHVSRNFRS